MTELMGREYCPLCDAMSQVETVDALLKRAGGGSEGVGLARRSLAVAHTYLARERTLLACPDMVSGS